VYLLFEPQYEAVAWLRIDEKAPHLAFESGMEERSQRFVNTQVELLHSPLVLGPVVREADIARFPEIMGQADPVKWLANQLAVRSWANRSYTRFRWRPPPRSIRCGS